MTGRWPYFAGMPVELYSPYSGTPVYIRHLSIQMHGVDLGVHWPRYAEHLAKMRLDEWQGRILAMRHWTFLDIYGGFVANVRRRIFTDMEVEIMSTPRPQDTKKYDHGETVRQLHIITPPEKTVEGALKFLLRLLPLLPVHERAGLLLKPAGENIVSYNGQMVSAGRICYPNGQIYKVLTDVPTGNGPGWHDDGTVDPSRYLTVVAIPGGGDDDGDKPPTDPDTVIGQLWRIQQGILALGMVLEVMDARLTRLEERAVVEARVQLVGHMAKGTLPWPFANVGGEAILHKRDPQAGPLEQAATPRSSSTVFTKPPPPPKPLR